MDWHGALVFASIVGVLTALGVIGAKLAPTPKPPPDVDGAWQRFATHLGLSLEGVMPSVTVSGTLSNGVHVRVRHSLVKKTETVVSHHGRHGVSFDWPTYFVSVTIPTTRGLDAWLRRANPLEPNRRPTGDAELDAAFRITGAEQDVMLLREPAVRSALLSCREALLFEIEGGTVQWTQESAADVAFIDGKLRSHLAELLLVAQAIAAAKEARAREAEAEAEAEATV